MNSHVPICMKILSSSYPLKRGRPLKEFDDSLGESTKKDEDAQSLKHFVP
jgi:hypothetical protein